MEEQKPQEQPKEQLAEDGKPRVITETIPAEYLKVIDEQKKNRQGLLNNFLQVSFQLATTQKEQQKIIDQLNDFDNSFRGKIEWVMRKMKLNKMQNRNWRYDGRESFIGIFNPPKSEKK